MYKSKCTNLIKLKAKLDSPGFLKSPKTAIGMWLESCNLEHN